MSTLAPHALRPDAPDKIFAASQKAKAAIARYGENAVINATLGECFDDEGKLMVLPTVETLLRTLPVEEFCSYAPIAGIPGYREAVLQSLFGEELPDYHMEVVATPGGCGALRHAVWNFTEMGDSILTADWYWGPYKTVCEEHGRELVSFTQFTENGAFHRESFGEELSRICKAQDYILILLNTPAQNPTGYTLSTGDFAGVLDTVRKEAKDKSKKINLCLDVSYIDYAGGFEQTRALFGQIKNLPENVLVSIVFSMSKSFTMCGMRCGALVCLAHTEEEAAEFRRAMSFSSRGVWSNTIRASQRILTEIVLNPERKAQADKERAVYRDLIIGRGKAFADAAKEAGLECSPYSAGFFIAIPCKHPDLIAEKLQEEKVFVVPLAKGLRFSPCAVTEEKCRKAPVLIKVVIDQWDRE